jgi:hypothetical protein
MIETLGSLKVPGAPDRKLFDLVNEVARLTKKRHL